MRALASHHAVWPGFDSRSWGQMLVEFVVGSPPCFESFPLGIPVFPSPQKPTFPNSNSIFGEGHWFVSFSVMCIPSLNKVHLFIYLFIYLLIYYYFF